MYASSSSSIMFQKKNTIKDTKKNVSDEEKKNTKQNKINKIISQSLQSHIQHFMNTASKKNALNRKNPDYNLQVSSHK